MTPDKKDNIDFGNLRIPKLFHMLFVPTLLGMLFNTAFLLADGIFIGRGIGPDGIAAINLFEPVMLFILSIGLMIGIGCSIISAIHLSRNNSRKARTNVTQAFIFAAVMAALISAVLYIVDDFILKILGVPAELTTYTKEYYIWFIPTCIFLMVQLVGEFIIRLDGSPKYAMYANVVPAILNIILDYVFIFPLGMGLKGAAIATDIGTFIGATMTLTYMFLLTRKLPFLRLSTAKEKLRQGIQNILKITRLGFPAFIGELSLGIMVLMGNYMFKRYLGNDGIAAFSVICYLFPAVYMVFSAVASSAQPIISFNYGACNRQRVHKAFSHSVSISMGFAAIVTLLFCLFSPHIVSVFVGSGNETFRLASEGLPLYALGFVFVAFNVSAIGYFQSVEKSHISTVLTALRGIALILITYTLLPKFLGEKGLWLAVPVAEILTLVIEIVVFRYLSRPSDESCSEKCDDFPVSED